jgi:hypothetical protein
MLAVGKRDSNERAVDLSLFLIQSVAFREKQSDCRPEAPNEHDGVQHAPDSMRLSGLKGSSEPEDTEAGDKQKHHHGEDPGRGSQARSAHDSGDSRGDEDETDQQAD